jgi:hypothetical protein
MGQILSQRGGGGGGSYDPNAPYVLEFTGADGCHVDHNYMWLFAPGTILSTSLLWEAWVKPLGSGYLISDGYGGQHAVLWGFTGSAGGPYTITGNIWNGTTVSFAGRYEFADGEWCHIMLGLLSGNLYTWVNGIGDSIWPFAGDRINPNGAGAGTGKLYVGGSDHNNLACRLAVIRGFDSGQFPPRPTYAFWPERFMLPAVSDGTTVDVAADFFVEYTHPTVGSIPDLSEGVVSRDGGDRMRHLGRRMDTSPALGASGYNLGVVNNFPAGPNPPEWVLDAGCPYGKPIGSPAPTEVTHTPGAVPDGALIHDSFGRANSTPAFQLAPTLGSTEGGSLGPLAYTSTHARPTFGILGGEARFIGHSSSGNGYTEGVWVEAGTADVDIRIRRGQADLKEAVTGGIIFRLQDANNFWLLWLASDNYGWIAPVVAGSSDGSEWSTYFDIVDAHPYIRVVADGSTITVYSSADGSSWTQRRQLTGQTTFQAATKVGLGGPINPSVTTWAAFSKIKSFTVFEAP